VIKTWTYPSDLSDNISPDGEDARRFPQVAMDDNGNAIITWHQYFQIFKSEYRNGAWSHPGDLSDNINPEVQTAWFPQVAMDDNGDAIITWHEFSQIFKSEYRNGTWTHPGDLNDKISPDGGVAYYPQVAMDDNGNAIITWRQNDGNNWQVFKSEYRNGVWTHPGDLSDNIIPDGGDAYEPHVAMDNNGNAIITWEQHDGNNNQIFKSEYRNGVWTHPGDLNDKISPDGGDACVPHVAMDDNGNAIITWEQKDGNLNRQVFKSEYRNGVWTHPSDLNDNINPDGDYGRNPQVAMDDNGNAIIAWEQDDGTFPQIFKSEYRNGVWTHPSDLNDNISPDGDYAWSPQVAMDDNGDAIITWEQIGFNLNKQVFKSEYRNGVWTHPSDLSDNISSDGEDAYEPNVAMDDNGNAIITWRQNDGNNWQIFKSEYR
jgi:hypothetical protein